MLTALTMGDDRAASLGVPVARLRLQVLAIVPLLAATAVAFVGTIGFVGLVGPHIVRLIIGEDQGYFLPVSAAAGRIILSLASTVSKAVVPPPIEETWRHVGHLVSSIEPGECSNYFRNAGYASIKT